MTASRRISSFTMISLCCFSFHRTRRLVRKSWWLVVVEVLCSDRENLCAMSTESGVTCCPKEIELLTFFPDENKKKKPKPQR